MRRYIDYEYFYSTLADLIKEDRWRLECENLYGEIYTLVFEKYMYEAQDGNVYPCIIYSYPLTLDAGIINYDAEDGWDLNITSVWNDITRGCDLRPFIEE